MLISTCIYIYIYIYIYNLHNGECASVFNALFKTRRVSAFAFLRGLNMQLLQSRNTYIYIYIYIYMNTYYISFLFSSKKDTCLIRDQKAYIFLFFFFKLRRFWKRVYILLYFYSPSKRVPLKHWCFFLDKN